MNLAVPPFDDIHVRKAMNLVLDKARLQEIRGGPTVAEVIGHIAVNSLENNLLLNYDPYATPGEAGSVVDARKEMALSKYDTNGDGLCDAPACSGIVALGLNISPEITSLAKEIRKELSEIGLRLRLKLMPGPDFVFPMLTDPKKHVALALNVAWTKDYLNASSYIVPLFAAGSIGDGAGNYSLLGATPDQLRQWGYAVTSVPGVDNRIDACLKQLGEAQLQCWVSFDQYLMEDVVPWVPYAIETHVEVLPRRIVRFSYDQFGDLPALDQIALRPAGS